MLMSSVNEVWFWQKMISPHMAELALALTRQGIDVVYVAEGEISEDRMQQGWKSPDIAGIKKVFIRSSPEVHTLVCSAPMSSVHICQGLRENGLISQAQTEMQMRGLRQWVVMETVDNAGWRGYIRRLLYSVIFLQKQKHLDGILANGHCASEWIAARGVPRSKVFPFAYFLPSSLISMSRVERGDGPFRFIFAGRLIPLKRVHWIIEALVRLKNKNFELWIVGAGSEESLLRELSTKLLDGKVRWLGQLASPDVPAVMAQADCLVLPSMHDGWGAVASEALLVGTPVVCSDACGVAGVVRNSGCGGVFSVGDLNELSVLLASQLAHGPIQNEQRGHISDWAKCLGADIGARYLHEILLFSQGFKASRPVPPWDIK